MTYPRNAGTMVIAAATLVLTGCPNDGTVLTTEGDTAPGMDSGSSSSAAATGEPTTSTTDPGPVTGEETLDSSGVTGDGTTTGTSSTTEPAATTTTGGDTTGRDTTGGGTTGGDTTGGDTTGGDTMGCGDTTGGDPDPMGAPPPAELQWSHSQVKQFHFTWQPVVGADYYQLLASADGGPEFAQVGGDICGTSTSIMVPLYFRYDARYILRSCNGDGCTDSAPVDVVGSLAPAVGYFKASNTEEGDHFGGDVALSADGSTLVVRAAAEDGAATGINGDQGNGAAFSGAVYVFVRVGSVWKQEAYIKASNTESGDHFGISVSLSDDGNTLAVGADDEDSAAMGVGGDQNSNGAYRSGAVYVFTRSGDEWSQQAYIKASNTGAEDHFGNNVALSGDGSTLAVGADEEDSDVGGVNGDQGNNLATQSGAVYVFKRTGETWAQQAYLKASNPGVLDAFGTAVALSTDGNTLAVSAPLEDSAATGIDGDQTDNSRPDTGAVYVFVRANDTWSQQAYIKASNADVEDRFGSRGLALSGDGNSLAVGTQFEASAATGVDGDQDSNDAPMSGAVYMFTRSNSVWAQTAYFKASTAGAGDGFGHAVALSSDGAVLAVSAVFEESAAVGINGDEADDSLIASGAAYVFTQIDGVWMQRAYIKAPNPDQSDYFGRRLALSGDGLTLAVGADCERSKATGIGGDQADNSAGWAGAVYLY